MGAHQYIDIPPELESPAIIKRAHYDALARAIRELQKHAITSIRKETASDGALVIDGEAFLDQIQSDNQTGSSGFTGTRLVVVDVVWDGTYLKLRPAWDTYKNGIFMSSSLGDYRIIDTPELC